jgi:small subunit ribosomal protein S17
MAETKTPAKKAPVKKAEAKPAAAPSQSTESSTVIIKGKALSTRGRTFVGTVISNRMSKTVTVEWERKKYVKKYQRYEKRRTRVKAHDPFGLAIGDIVEIVETRPISKTKNFLVTRKLK